MKHLIPSAIKFIKENALIVSYAVIIITFLVPRFFFFYYLPIPGVDPDSYTYWRVAYQILEGELPAFNIRTPIYPIFLYLVSLISNNIIAIPVIQSIATLAVALFFIRTVHKYLKPLHLYATIAVSLVISSDAIMRFDFSVLPESFYTNSIVLIVCFIIRAFKEEKSFNWLMISLLTGILLLLRPSALFMVPLLAFFIIFFVLKKYNFRYYTALIAPLCLIIIALCTYNYFSLKKFTISPWGDVNLVGTTLLFVDTSKTFPDSVNAIVSKAKLLTNNSDREIVKNSYDISKLKPAFYNGYCKNMAFFDLFTGEDYDHKKALQSLKTINMITSEAIHSNIDIYAKFFITSFIYQFSMLTEKNYNFYAGSLLENQRWLYKYSNVKLDRGIVTDGPISQDVIRYGLKNLYNKERYYGQSQFDKMVSNPFFKLYDIINMKVRPFFYNNSLILLIYFLTLILLIVNLFISKFTHIETLIFFSIGIIPVLSVTLISLVEVPLKRYLAPTDLAIYVCIGYLVFAIRKYLKK